MIIKLASKYRNKNKMLRDGGKNSNLINELHHKPGLTSEQCKVSHNYKNSLLLVLQDNAGNRRKGLIITIDIFFFIQRATPTLN